MVFTAWTVAGAAVGPRAAACRLVPSRVIAGQDGQVGRPRIVVAGQERLVFSPWAYVWAQWRDGQHDAPVAGDVGDVDAHLAGAVRQMLVGRTGDLLPALVVAELAGEVVAVLPLDL